MKLQPSVTGQLLAIVAAASFGLSGVFAKPLLEAGWTPAAAVTVRAAIGGLVLAPWALRALRGRWTSLAAAWRRVLGMGLIGVAGTQLFYYAAVIRIPVGTAVLLEYMAPVLLVLVAWIAARRAPKAVVLVGSAVAIGGLALVVSPSSSGGLDPVGLLFAVAAMFGCAIYFVIAARPSAGLPPVALASAGLLVGAVTLGLVSATGAVPFAITTGNVELFGTATPWWIPMLVVGVVATAVAYAASITSTELIGSRLASFLGLLEVAAATVYAWLLLGEKLSLTQLLGGALILLGIGFVRSDRSAPESAGGPITRPVDAALTERAAAG